MSGEARRQEEASVPAGKHREDPGGPGPAFNWLDEAHPRGGRLPVLLGLDSNVNLIQSALREIPQNNVQPNVWVPAKLTHKTKHHSQTTFGEEKVRCSHPGLFPWRTVCGQAAENNRGRYCFSYSGNGKPLRDMSDKIRFFLRISLYQFNRNVAFFLKPVGVNVSSSCNLEVCDFSRAWGMFSSPRF